MSPRRERPGNEPSLSGHADAVLRPPPAGVGKGIRRGCADARLWTFLLPEGSLALSNGDPAPDLQSRRTAMLQMSVTYCPDGGPNQWGIFRRRDFLAPSGPTFEEQVIGLPRYAPGLAKMCFGLGGYRPLSRKPLSARHPRSLRQR